MLILQRRVGESVMLGEDISVSVVSVKKGMVRLAISAPEEVPILRNELLAATEANRDAAMELTDPTALLDLLSHRETSRQTPQISQDGKENAT